MSIYAPWRGGQEHYGTVARMCISSATPRRSRGTAHGAGGVDSIAAARPTGRTAGRVGSVNEIWPTSVTSPGVPVGRREKAHQIMNKDDPGYVERFVALVRAAEEDEFRDVPDEPLRARSSCGNRRTHRARCWRGAISANVL